MYSSNILLLLSEGFVPQSRVSQRSSFSFKLHFGFNEFLYMHTPMKSPLPLFAPLFTVCLSFVALIYFCSYSSDVYFLGPRPWSLLTEPLQAHSSVLF